MRLIIVTGMSGAGKGSVFNMLEDRGFFCVDNLPITLIPTFIQLVNDSSEEIEKVALGLDIRSRHGLAGLEPVLQDMNAKKIPFEMLFLDASTPVLVKRYKETRRVHPLNTEGRIDKAIEEERERLAFLKEQADYIIDTSTFLIRDLKQEIDRLFVNGKGFCSFYITFLSFGYKYGIPADSDLVFDVRFLPNPFYVEELKPLTGNDQKVYDYVMESSKSHEFLKKLQDMLEFLIPNYIAEGKNQLVVAIGCTGGKHRSVTLTNAIYSLFENSEYGCKKEHRDIEKDRVRNICRLQEK
jgi:UPF0042 nucleotide-binding protein